MSSSLASGPSYSRVLTLIALSRDQPASARPEPTQALVDSAGIHAEVPRDGSHNHTALGHLGGLRSERLVQRRLRITGVDLRGIGQYEGAGSGTVASRVTGLYPWVGFRPTERMSVLGRRRLRRRRTTARAPRGRTATEYPCCQGPRIEGRARPPRVVNPYIQAPASTCTYDGRTSRPIPTSPPVSVRTDREVTVPARGSDGRARRTRRSANP